MCQLNGAQRPSTIVFWLRPKIVLQMANYRAQKLQIGAFLVVGFFSHEIINKLFLTIIIPLVDNLEIINANINHLLHTKHCFKR